MRLSKAFPTLGRNDSRLVTRDTFLLFAGSYVLFIALVMRWAVPWLTDTLLAQTGFDLTPYYPVIAGWLTVVIGPQIAGVLFGFLLLEEKDEHTLEALRVTPLPLRTFLSYRIIVATILGAVMAVAVLLIVDLVALPVWQLIAIASVAGLFAPLAMLFFAIAADNKVEGFALMKITGVLGLLPIAAWFIPEPWQYLAGVFPPYWATKALWTAAAGEQTWPIYLAIGAVTSLAAIWLLLRRFDQAVGAMTAAAPASPAASGPAVETS